MCGIMGVGMRTIGIDVFVMMVVVELVMSIVRLVACIRGIMIMTVMWMVVGIVGMSMAPLGMIMVSMGVVVTMAVMGMPESSQTNDVDHKSGRTHNEQLTESVYVSAFFQTFEGVRDDLDTD